MLILCYEPDPLERELLKTVLEHEGLRTEVYPSEAAVLRRAKAEPGALALARVEDAPRGLALVRALRTLGALPIVSVVMGPDEELAARLYDAGADEVLVRPIGPRLLVARLEALLRRASAAAPAAQADPEARIQVGEFRLVLTLQQLHVRERIVLLTPLQTRLLGYLMRHAGQPVSKSLLERRLWGCDGEGYGEHLKSHVCHLRRKLHEAAPDFPDPIATVKGEGYQFRRACG